MLQEWCSVLSDIIVEGAKELANKLYDLGVYTADGERWGRRVAERTREALQRVTDTWTHKPEFRITVRGRMGGATTLRVSTDDEIFHFVNMGTRPHLIQARNAPVLAFPSQFRPKTMPGSLRSGPGFSGGPTVLRFAVWHPGTEPRRFDDTALAWGQKHGLRQIRADLDKLLGGQSITGPSVSESRW